MNAPSEETEETIAGRFARGEAGETETPRRSFFRRFRAEPLLPEAGAGGAPLTAVIAVMSFLAALALAGFLFIAEAAGEWTHELRSSVTVQVKGPDAAAIATGADAAMRVLRSTDGVIEARLSSPDEAAELLEPWLGKGNVGAYLNVPALIDVRIDQSLRSELDLLETRLRAAAPGAVLDDHGAWRDRLAAAARTGQILAFSVFLLIMGAACAISAFAARAGLAANHEIVSILHLVGATDDFIAGQVQRRFFVLGLRGSLAGLAVAALALGIAALATRAGEAGDFTPAFPLGPGLFATLLVVPIALCLVAAVTARLTVLRTLAREL